MPSHIARQLGHPLFQEALPVALKDKFAQEREMGASVDKVPARLPKGGVYFSRTGAHTKKAPLPWHHRSAA